jgi:hypothetical protein
MERLRRDVREAFARQQAGLDRSHQAQARLLRQVLSTARTSRNLVPQLAGGAATLLVAGAVAVAVLLTHDHLGQQTSTQATGIEQALTAGAPAVIGPTSDRSFVWLTGWITQPAQGTGSQGGRVTGETVQVLDWTGQVRYHFQLPQSTLPQGLNEIQAISADGTRALLDDGSVLDETGAVIGKIPSLKSDGPARNHPRWTSDDHGVCAALSNQPVAPYVAMPPKGQGSPPPRTLPPSAMPGADHSVTLRFYGLDGNVRTIATVGSGPLGTTSGFFGDSASVLACNPSTDLAVVARYHDADTNPDDMSTTNMTVSLWAIKLSTGATLFHQPETRMALGRAFFFGSQNGQLVVEFLWNSKVWGSETDVVLQMPSGHPVPVLDAEPIPDTPGLSADGTRILRRVVDTANGQTVLERILRRLAGKPDDLTDLELIDATSGRVVRQVVIPGIVGASAVAQPGGSSFMVEIDGYLALVDQDGGISLLHPAVNLAGPSGVGLSWPGLQG